MRLSFIVALAMGCTLASRAAEAAPLPVPIPLPLRAEDVEALRQEAGSPERLADVLSTLEGIRVYPSVEGEIRIAKTTFVAAPYFAADPAAPAVGEQVIARDALALLDAYDKLLREGGAPATALLALANAAAGMSVRGAELKDQIGAFADPDAAERLARELASAAVYTNGLASLEAAARSLFGQLPPDDRRSIVAATMAFADRLSVPLDARDLALASSDPVGFVFGLLPRFRGAIATMSFGYRTATFVGGWNARQRAALSLYRKVRPDVRIQSLSAEVFVRPVAQTATSPYAPNGVAPSVMMIRGINAATAGACGSTRACNVVVEYTEVGARSALLSTTGASLFPVTFYGRLPGEARPSTCRLALRASGSPIALPTDALDALDGPAVRQPVAVDGSTCTAADAAVILARSYHRLLHERAQRSLAVKATYTRNAARRWIAVARPLPRDVPSREPVLVGLEPGSTLGRTITALPAAERGKVLASMVGARNAAYWPLVGDSSLDGVVLVEPGDAAPTELPFDGFPVVCWKPGDAGPVLAACPENLAGRADTQLATSEAAAQVACSPDTDVLTCGDTLASGPTDDDGFLDVFAGL